MMSREEMKQYIKTNPNAYEELNPLYKAVVDAYIQNIQKEDRRTAPANKARPKTSPS